MKYKTKKLVITKRVHRRGHYYQVTRDMKGRFIRFRKWKPQRKMWRLTIAINYGIHSIYYCIKQQAWHRSRKTLEHMMIRLQGDLMEKLERHTGYSGSDLDNFPIRIGHGYEKVVFDSILVGTEEFSDEKLSSSPFVKKRKKR